MPKGLGGQLPLTAFFATTSGPSSSSKIQRSRKRKQDESSEVRAARSPKRGKAKLKGDILATDTSTTEDPHWSKVSAAPSNSSHLPSVKSQSLVKRGRGVLPGIDSRAVDPSHQSPVSLTGHCESFIAHTPGLHGSLRIAASTPENAIGNREPSHGYAALPTPPATYLPVRKRTVSKHEQVQRPTDPYLASPNVTPFATTHDYSHQLPTPRTPTRHQNRPVCSLVFGRTLTSSPSPVSDSSPNNIKRSNLLNIDAHDVDSGESHWVPSSQTPELAPPLYGRQRRPCTNASEPSSPIGIPPLRLTNHQADTRLALPSPSLRASSIYDKSEGGVVFSSQTQDLAEFLTSPGRQVIPTSQLEEEELVLSSLSVASIEGSALAEGALPRDVFGLTYDDDLSTPRRVLPSKHRIMDRSYLSNAPAISTDATPGPLALEPSKDTERGNDRPLPLKVIHRARHATPEAYTIPETQTPSQKRPSDFPQTSFQRSHGCNPSCAESADSERWRPTGPSLSSTDSFSQIDLSKQSWERTPERMGNVVDENATAPPLASLLPALMSAKLENAGSVIESDMGFIDVDDIDSVTDPESDYTPEPTNRNKFIHQRTMDYAREKGLPLGDRSPRDEATSDDGSATEPESDDELLTKPMNLAYHKRYPGPGDSREWASQYTTEHNHCVTPPELRSLPAPVQRLISPMQSQCQIEAASIPKHSGNAIDLNNEGGNVVFPSLHTAAGSQDKDNSSETSDTPFSIPEYYDAMSLSADNPSVSGSIPSEVADFFGIFETDEGTPH
ncbi:unnamed protein product [Somion occarium]|uniref:Uncharacterized protein n=1 Tax=Somion occarium TaxID=3059160 RepID=A0ABP1D384_9APHY